MLNSQAYMHKKEAWKTIKVIFCKRSKQKALLTNMQMPQKRKATSFDLTKWPKDNTRAETLSIVFLPDRNNELARAVHVMIARAKRIYISMIKQVIYFFYPETSKRNRKHSAHFYLVIKHFRKFGRTSKSFGNTFQTVQLAHIPTAFLALPNFHSCFSVYICVVVAVKWRHHLNNSLFNTYFSSRGKKTRNSGQSTTPSRWKSYLQPNKG